MSNYLRPYGLQHARLHSPSPFPRACSNSCPLNQKFHPTISSSVIFFSSYLESFPASGSFPTGWLFISVVKYWSFSFSISLSNEYAGLISFRIDWFDHLATQGTLKSLLQHTTVQKYQFFSRSAFFVVQLSHPYMTVGKTIALTRWTFAGIFLVISSKALTKLYIEITFYKF